MSRHLRTARVEAAKVLELRGTGTTVAAIVRQTGMSRASVYRILAGGRDGSSVALGEIGRVTWLTGPRFRL
jgi:DNA invertase Pin-like site-specific DNA recombinase